MLKVQFRIEDFALVLTTAAYEKGNIGRAYGNVERASYCGWKLKIWKWWEYTHPHLFLEANIWDLPNFTITINILTCSKFLKILYHLPPLSIFI